MRIVQSLPNLQRSDEWHKVYARDISREGISFLHSEQLFPGEKVQISLKDKRQYIAVVRRGRRIAKKCYLVGVRLTAGSTRLAKSGGDGTAGL
jgi:hypothetical protein